VSVTLHEPAIEPVPEALLARWRAIPVAVAVDLAPERQIDPAVRPLRQGQADLFGRAVTARCLPPDFGAVLAGVGRTGRGEVLVIDAGGAAGPAMIGEVLGGEIARRGAAGLVCDGAVRDTAGLARLPGLPVYARSVDPRGPASASGGEVGGPVTIGGCRVAPGDLVIGDGDGLVALPPRLLGALIEAAEARQALEAEWTARLPAGERIEEVFGLA
jgi:regulator of RNase E activity RraA